MVKNASGISAGEKLLAAVVMLTRPCSLFESTRMPATSSATRNLRSSGRNARIFMNSAIRFFMSASRLADLACLGEGCTETSESRIQAPLSFPLYALSSSVDLAFTWTTGPRLGPSVEGLQPADSSRIRCSTGTTTRPLASPRVHARSIVHGSRCAFDNPYCLNLSRVHWLALVRFGEPVSRGPIMSQRYSMLAISSERLSISSRIAWVTALTSPLGSFAEALAPAGRASAFGCAPGRSLSHHRGTHKNAENGDRHTSDALHNDNQLLARVNNRSWRMKLTQRRPPRYSQKRVCPSPAGSSISDRALPSRTSKQRIG